MVTDNKSLVAITKSPCKYYNITIEK